MAFRKWQDLMDEKREKLGPEKWAEYERKLQEKMKEHEEEESEDGIPRQ